MNIVAKKCLVPFLSVLVMLSGWIVTPAFAGDNGPAGKASLSTHVLNTTSGKPAVGLAVALQRLAGKEWEELGRGLTDRQGRTTGLCPAGKSLVAGTYRLVFETGDYFRGLGSKTFFPRVELIFEIDKNDEHYHVPLLLSPFGYSTYRGS